MKGKIFTIAKFVFIPALVFCAGVFLFSPEAEAATYEESFTSDVIDNYYNVDYGAVSWNADVPATTSLVVKIRVGDDTNTSDSSWTSWSTISSSGESIPASFDGHRYLQYRLEFGTNDTGQSPAVYDTGGLDFDLHDLSWSENLNGSSDVAFLMAYSSDNSSWSSWQGPSDGTWGQALQEFFTDPGGSSEEIDEGFDGNRYFQYKAVLASEGVGGSDFPEISQVDMAYKVSTSTYM